MLCTCLGTTPTAPPPCPLSGRCLSMADIVVACANAAGPCGAQGEVDMFFEGGDPLKPYCHKYSACCLSTQTTTCTTKPTLKVIEFDTTILATAVIVIVGSDVRLRWTTKTGTQNKWAEVIVKACCNGFENLFKVFVCVKDLCNPCPSCEPEQTCNPCTGGCVAKALDLSVEDENQSCDSNDVSVV